jgi:hypothetical protein
MNKCNGIDENEKRFRWEAGMESDAFFTREMAIEAAKKTWRQVYPTALRLCIGTRDLAGYEIIEEIDRR